MNTPTVSLVTLGCARNDVDAEELAARLEGEGWRVVGGDALADVTLVNTCGFVAAAKSESVDTLLSSGADGRPVVAVGCLAERYGIELSEALPEAAAVVGFDGYEQLGATLRAVIAGERVPSHVPRDRRRLLPVTPAARAGGHRPPGHGTVAVDLPGITRRRLRRGPVAPLKIASGCDRRCAFCAIPRFRGAFLSRPVAEIVREAEWLGGQGVREVLLVSENSTSYGKDLGDPHLLETLLRTLVEVPGVDRVRVTYLQPAEMRPSLIEAMATTPGVAPYFDLSFQHAAPGVLRRMRRFGDADSFLALVARIRQELPQAGIRSNVILGFPGETESDVSVLHDFLAVAELDAVGVFGYSNEDGTEAEGMPGQVDADEIAQRVARTAVLADVVAAGRAERRVGDVTRALVVGDSSADVLAVADFQGPEDGTTRLADPAPHGTIATARIVASDGVDLIAEWVE